MGEKLVSITPGQDTQHLVTDGGTLQGDKVKSVDDVMDNANKLLNNVNDMMKNVNSVIGDEKTQGAMRGSIQNIAGITGNVNDMLAANAGNVQQMTANMAAITGQLNESVQRMDGDGKMSADMRSSWKISRLLRTGLRSLRGRWKISPRTRRAVRTFGKPCIIRHRFPKR